jgi:hypothetical protein
MRIVVLFVLVLAVCSFADGQSCRPAELNYIVRDETGKVLSERELKDIFKQMKEGVTGVGSVSLTEEGTLVGYSGKEPKETLPVIYVVDAAACHIKVGEFTLQIGGHRMRLIFDLELDRRALTIDSLPFQAGTYRLDKRDLENGFAERIVPATRWKRVGR